MKDKEFKIEIQGGSINVMVKEWSHEQDRYMNAALASSGIKTTEMDEENVEYNAAIDGMEALLMSMVALGFDVGSKKMIEAIDNVIEGIANNT